VCSEIADLLEKMSSIDHKKEDHQLEVIEIDLICVGSPGKNKFFGYDKNNVVEDSHFRREDCAVWRRCVWAWLVCWQFLKRTKFFFTVHLFDTKKKKFF
jgi:hypothetical protein